MQVIVALKPCVYKKMLTRDLTTMRERGILTYAI